MKFKNQVAGMRGIEREREDALYKTAPAERWSHRKFRGRQRAALRSPLLPQQTEKKEALTRENNFPTCSIYGTLLEAAKWECWMALRHFLRGELVDFSKADTTASHVGRGAYRIRQRRSELTMGCYKARKRRERNNEWHLTHKAIYVRNNYTRGYTE